MSGIASLVLKGITTLIVVFAPFVVVFVLPFIARLVAPAVGWTLRKKTEGRRSQLVTIMNEDGDKFKAASPELKGTLGGKKRTVEAAGLCISDGSQRGVRKDWDGIVGFFHPFWYDACKAPVLEKSVG